MFGQKIVCLFGSPRKDGNTRHTLDWVIEGASKFDAEFTEIDTARLIYNGYGCTSCQACQKSDEFRCVLQDDATDLIASLPEYDIILFATPVYWMSFPAQLKIFLDRTYSLIKMDEAGFDSPLKGKKFALLCTGGGMVKDNISILCDQVQSAATLLGMGYRSLVFGEMPMDSSKILENEEIQHKCINFGKDIASWQ